ncbi:aminotransferase class I/II-fold pyridoxal phosphate-dependent enzyme [Rhodospirillaceae bacterium SYSU D60014]|uniref:aminotransferase class I/II-fold pyridoxal phosphate-dependent enzyme n=1 Tax=Virgifigura deserti TaxID=2268457 RepID=UPI000E6671D4
MKPETFKLERYFARYEFSTKYLLSSSDCESVTVADLLTLEPNAREDFDRLWLGYTESHGDPALRQTVSALYDTVSADEVLIHTGAEEAIFAFMNVVLQPGDHIIVHAPAYQSLHEIARTIGAEVTEWRADEQDGWSLDPEALRQAIRGNTKAIVLNCPHNPTGYLMDRERFSTVVAVARAHGLYLFSDEVYRELEHDPADRLPAACDLYERAVSLGVMSKTYGLPGLRIGWIATKDATLYNAMAGFKDYLTICNSAPSEFLARLALQHRRMLAERSRRIVLDNLDLLDGFFDRQQHLFAWQRPEAGPIAFPRLLTGGAEAFCKRIVEQAGVLLLPSTLYDAGDSHIRFGFGRKNLPEAVEHLEAALSP